MKSIFTCALALVLGTGVAFGISGCKKEEKKAADTNSAAAPAMAPKADGDAKTEAAPKADEPKKEEAPK